MADILIYGRLRNATTENVIVSTDQVRDEVLGKPQQDINQDIQKSKVDKTIEINGHALDKNVTVTKGDVGLGDVTNDAQVKRIEMGVASGVATLDTTGKIPPSQLPDELTNAEIDEICK